MMGKSQKNYDVGPSYHPSVLRIKCDPYTYYVQFCFTVFLILSTFESVSLLIICVKGMEKHNNIIKTSLNDYINKVAVDKQNCKGDARALLRKEFFFLSLLQGWVLKLEGWGL